MNTTTKRALSMLTAAVLIGGAGGLALSVRDDEQPVELRIDSGQIETSSTSVERSTPTTLDEALPAAPSLPGVQDSAGPAQGEREASTGGGSAQSEPSDAPVDPAPETTPTTSCLPLPPPPPSWCGDEHFRQLCGGVYVDPISRPCPPPAPEAIVECQAVDCPAVKP